MGFLIRYILYKTNFPAFYFVLSWISTWRKRHRAQNFFCAKFILRKISIAQSSYCAKCLLRKVYIAQNFNCAKCLLRKISRNSFILHSTWKLRSKKIDKEKFKNREQFRQPAKFHGLEIILYERNCFLKKKAKNVSRGKKRLRILQRLYSFCGKKIFKGGLHFLSTIPAKF